MRKLIIPISLLLLLAGCEQQSQPYKELSAEENRSEVPRGSIATH